MVSAGGRTRLQSMDLLKFLAIFLVLWGHCEQYLLSADYWDRAVYRHIYSFHMPLFMMIAGFFFAMTVRPGVISNLLHKARQLLLPVVSWSLILFFASAIYHRQLPPAESFVNNAVRSLWFLKSVFACSVLGLLPFLVFRKHFGAAAVVTLLISQILNWIPVVELPYMYPAFLTGGIIYRHHESFRTNARLIVPLCGFIWLVCNLFLDADTYRAMKIDVLAYPSFYTFDNLCWKLYEYTMGLCGAWPSWGFSTWCSASRARGEPPSLLPAGAERHWAYTYSRPICSKISLRGL